MEDVMKPALALLRSSAAISALAAVAACGDGQPTAAEGGEQQYVPSFGGSGGAASTELSGLRLPSAMTCRFVSQSGRVECGPITADGMIFRASYQFLDAQGRPQARRDDRTDTINERTEMVGAPAAFRTFSLNPGQLDSVVSRSDVTRRGLLDSVYVFSGEHIVQIRPHGVLSASNSTSTITDARTTWRDLRYPRAAVLFQPAPPRLILGGPAINPDSALAVFGLSGAWARSGTRIDQTVSTAAYQPVVPTDTTLQIIIWTYESPDVARVEIERSANPKRRSTCRVERMSLSARCQ
jgi:hypothetical protein